MIPAAADRDVVKAILGLERRRGERAGGVGPDGARFVVAVGSGTVGDAAVRVDLAVS